MPPPGEYGAGECFESVTTTQTLAEVNGYGVLLWLLAPCIAAIVVAGLLILSRRGSRFAKVAAWVVVGLFALLAFISGFSIGMYFVPAAVLVALAVALSPPLGTARCRDLLPREM